MAQLGGARAPEAGDGDRRVAWRLPDLAWLCCPSLLTPALPASSLASRVPFLLLECSSSAFLDTHHFQVLLHRGLELKCPPFGGDKPRRRKQHSLLFASLPSAASLSLCGILYAAYFLRRFTSRDGQLCHCVSRTSVVPGTHAAVVHTGRVTTERSGSAFVQHANRTVCSVASWMKACG